MFLVVHLHERRRLQLGSDVGMSQSGLSFVGSQWIRDLSFYNRSLCLHPKPSFRHISIDVRTWTDSTCRNTSDSSTILVNAFKQPAGQLCLIMSMTGRWFERDLTTDNSVATEISAEEICISFMSSLYSPFGITGADAKREEPLQGCRRVPPLTTPRGRSGDISTLRFYKQHHCNSLTFLQGSVNDPETTQGRGWVRY